MASGICFIGAGAMGGATIRGLLRKNVYSTAEIVACDSSQVVRDSISKELGIGANASNPKGVSGAEIVLLTVKPQHLENVMAEIYPSLTEEKLVISFVAGATLATLTAHLHTERVIRAIPNTPAQLGQGITLWTAASGVDHAGSSKTRRILEALGAEMYTPDERHIDMATAVSGSGPAYALAVLEAWTDAGVLLGLPRPMSEKLALETIRGTMAMVDASDLHPALLRAQVTSPGGTTAAALQVLEEDGLRAAFGRAITAAYSRSIELGEKRP